MRGRPPRPRDSVDAELVDWLTRSGSSIKRGDVSLASLVSQAARGRRPDPVHRIADRFGMHAQLLGNLLDDAAVAPLVLSSALWR